ncbi:type IV fimbrial biogenesis protein FimT [Oryzomicrobium terrae]|uniref:Type II secretion system protein H n=1 Tax=Oryzomicrobium terrae TaxID=1735038 RepID=A0A5C1E5W6_9RHOO|nr:GspH/FimT family pseudopilin [Oryzomicrobium terrae]QEL64290.1 type IV fimbrial biogenesis protein FimT [Oryzomicrobium terrae]
MHATAARRARAGFTLIEMMVALAVLAILIGIGVPSFSELIASQRARAATSALHDGLMLARSEAIKRNISVSLKTTDLAAGWTIIYKDASNNDVTLRSEPATPGLTFNPAAPTISYNGFGRLSAGANTKITVTARGSSKTRCVTVDTVGRPQISDGACP